jgi:hypothetical protein
MKSTFISSLLILMSSPIFAVDNNFQNHFPQQEEKAEKNNGSKGSNKNNENESDYKAEYRPSILRQVQKNDLERNQDLPSTDERENRNEVHAMGKAFRP